MKRKLREWRVQKCNPCFSAKSPPRSTDLQSTRFSASPYKAACTNSGKFGATFGHGTVIAPTQYLYQKEATGMESPKMKSLFQCKKPTSQYEPSNYPASCIAVYSRRYEFAKFGATLAMVVCLHQSNIYIQRKLREWRAQKCNRYFSAKSPPSSRMHPDHPISYGTSRGSSYKRSVPMLCPSSVDVLATPLTVLRAASLSYTGMLTVMSSPLHTIKLKLNACSRTRRELVE